jgi:hypothetical protein
MSVILETPISRGSRTEPPPLGQREIGTGFGDANMRRTGEFQPTADHRTAQCGDHRHAAVLNPVEHPMPHLRMPQAVGGILLGQFRQIEPGREMIADAMDHHRADAVGDGREAMLDLQHDAVVQRIAFGGAIEADAEHRADRLDLEQRGSVRGRGSSGIGHRDYVLCRIVMFYNELRGSQSIRLRRPGPGAQLRAGSRDPYSVSHRLPPWQWPCSTI